MKWSFLASPMTTRPQSVDGLTWRAGELWVEVQGVPMGRGLPPLVTV